MAKARKKWSALVGKYPYLQERASAYEDGINQKARELVTLPMGDLTAAYRAAAKAEEDADDVLRLAKAETEACTRALFQRMEQDGLEGVVIGDEMFSPTVEPYPQVKDKGVFLKWAIAEHEGNLMMHAGTLKSICKSAIEGEGDMPPGVDMFLKRKLTPRKA